MVSATIRESVSFQRPLRSVTTPASTRVTLVSCPHPNRVKAVTAAIANHPDFITITPALQQEEFPVHTNGSERHATAPAVCLLLSPADQTSYRHSSEQNRGPAH